ncbi:MAG: hypothetical protein IJ877_04215 [Candidatus Gastranaerophilales bacterium]|nr:hypothetical protein [Candidatus Gastranaerophilales bacterium]
MDNEQNKVLFDPGYAPIVINSIGQVGYTYYMFNAINNIKVKRQNFKIICPKLENLLRINIAFYLGCLLWASYIKQFDNYEIIGNKLLNETCTQDEYTSEINFLLDFVENKFPRDYKYYNNKQYIPDETYIPILKAYKEFLILNNGFTNCSKTNQIVLPSNLKQLNKEQLENINENIQTAIQSKNLEKLFNSYSTIF